MFPLFSTLGQSRFDSTRGCFGNGILLAHGGRDSHGEFQEEVPLPFPVLSVEPVQPSGASPADNGTHLEITSVLSGILSPCWLKTAFVLSVVGQEVRLLW